MNTDILDVVFDKVDNPGLDTLDPRFAEISGAVTAGDYARAGADCLAVIEEKIYDIRIIAYFLYSVFTEEGPRALSSIAKVLARTLDENYEAVGPARNKEKHAKTSLVWFSRTLLRKLTKEEERQGPDWRLWTENVSSDEAQDAKEKVDALIRVVAATLEDNAKPVMDNLDKVSKWLGAFAVTVYREPEPEEAEDEIEEELEEDSDDLPTDTEAAKGPAQSETFAAGPAAEGSYHLQVLIKKMRAFEKLVEDEKYVQAAVAADDINRAIENFDPRVYFPNLFSSFSRKMVEHVDSLSEADEMRETPAWNALSALFSVDIDGFVDL